MRWAEKIWTARLWRVIFGVSGIVFALAAYADTNASAPLSSAPEPESNTADTFKSIRQDQKTIQEESNAPDGDGVLVGGEIKPRDFYRDYLSDVAEISRDLLHVREVIEAQNRSLSLQQLGALTQRVAVAKVSLRRKMTHGEEGFYTYQLIDTAVASLQQAIEYWRVSNRIRPWLRGGLSDKKEDEEILQLKLQAALNAIEALRDIVQTRRDLSEDLDADR